jgi:Fur family ferric uptake transcriptional regulator
MPVRELVIYEGRSSARPAFAARVARVFAEHLAKNGLRLTGQRRAILDLLLRSDRHLSQEEMYKTLRGGGIGRATVFRTLKTLQECGLAAPVVGRDGVPRFEINRERPHHDHLICVQCGHIHEVRWPRLEKIQEEACKRLGFEPRWHRHEVFGLCRDCARKTRP